MNNIKVYTISIEFMNKNDITFSNYNINENSCYVDYDNLIKFNIVYDDIVILRRLEKRFNKLKKI